MSTDLQGWIGRSETADDLVTPAPYAALCATLDRPVERPEPGTPLPPLWPANSPANVKKSRGTNAPRFHANYRFLTLETKL
jgi:hypothetical protein